MSATAATRDLEGLFGPDSVTWRVHADPILWIGGLRALLLQAMHPAVLAGVLQHSGFRADPWGRLLRTADYVGTVTFGTGSEVAAVGARVRRLHATVSGTDPRTGVSYNAADPELLRWVHCSEVESFATAYRRGGGRLTDEDLDTYYDEQRCAAQVVGIDPATVPGSRGEMAEYFTRMRPQLVVDRHTRRVAAAIVAPPMPAWVRLATPARPAWATAAGLGFGLLPRWARRMYGLPGLPLVDLTAVVGTRTLHAALAAAPQRFREGPHLQQAKARLAAAAAQPAG